MKDGNYIILDGDIAHSVGEFSKRGDETVDTQLAKRAEMLGIKTPRIMTVKQYEKSAKHKNILAEGAAANIRAERNGRMSESDWTQLPDVAERDGAPDRVAWATYRRQVMLVARQALDNGAVIDSIEWPDKPE